MIVSRNVFDPTWPLPNNKAAKTLGVYGHLPKYWKCNNYDFDGYWKNLVTPFSFELEGKKMRMDAQYAEDDPFIDELKADAQESREAHAKCRKNKRHRSHVGYLRFVGPKKTRTVWYMGNPYRHKIFESGTGGTVVFRGKVVRKPERLKTRLL